MAFTGGRGVKAGGVERVWIKCLELPVLFSDQLRLVLNGFRLVSAVWCGNCADHA